MVQTYCPFVNGYGVYKARTLLHIFSYYTKPNDKYLCNAAGMYKNGGGEDEPTLNTDLLFKQMDDEIRLYPNPFDKELTMEYKLKSGEEAIFTLHDLVGKEMYRQRIESSANRITLHLPELSKGVYLYKYSTANGEINYTGKLIKE